ncbi:MAG: hypothetical protein R3F59_22475 [Myxococcota bacterium]
MLMDVAEPGAASVVEVDARAWVGRSAASRPEETLSPAEALEAVTAAVADPEADLAAALQAALDAGVPQRDPRLVAAAAPRRPRHRPAPLQDAEVGAARGDGLRRRRRRGRRRRRREAAPRLPSPTTGRSSR